MVFFPRRPQQGQNPNQNQTMKKDILAAAVIIALTPAIMAGLDYIMPKNTGRTATPDQLREFYTPRDYTPPVDSAARVRAFIHGDVYHVEDADLHAPSVSPSLRKAALNLMD
jgi:hypothetical protein